MDKIEAQSRINNLIRDAISEIFDDPDHAPLIAAAFGDDADPTGNLNVRVIAANGDEIDEDTISKIAHLVGGEPVGFPKATRHEFGTQGPVDAEDKEKITAIDEYFIELGRSSDPKEAACGRLGKAVIVPLQEWFCVETDKSSPHIVIHALEQVFARALATIAHALPWKDDSDGKPFARRDGTRKFIERVTSKSLDLSNRILDDMPTPDELHEKSKEAAKTAKEATQSLKIKRIFGDGVIKGSVH